MLPVQPYHVAGVALTLFDSADKGAWASMAIVLALFGLGLALIVGAAAAVRFQRDADRGLWLAALMTALAAQMVANVALATGAILARPHLAQLHVPLAFAIGPLLYLHTAARMHATPPRRRWLHFLAAVMALVLLVPFYLSDADAKRTFMTAALQRYPTMWRVRQALLITHLGAYVFASWRISRSIARESRDFIWSRGLVLAGSAIWATAALRFIVAYQATTAPFAMAVSAVGLAAVVLAGLAAPTVAARRSRQASRSASADETECLQLVLHRLQHEELFRARDLTLEKLAAAVGTTTHFLSGVVNARCGTTVPELVNRCRVEAAQKMLTDPAHTDRPIHEIAEAVGFASRSAFNAAFRRHAGASPRALRTKPS
jgi:AraC-like DNA-binding protein